MLCYQTVTVKANPTYTPAEYLTAINAAASRVVALQSPTDFGWDWIVTGLTAHSASPSASNLYGVTALDLIGASKKTGSPADLEAAENVGNELMTGNVTNWGVYTGSFPPYQWGFAFDYVFMMELAAATGNSAYSTFATAAWAWQKANAQSGRFASASASWTYYITAGLDVGAATWDSAAWGLATLLLGDTVWSNAMADIIHSNMGALTTETITGNSGNNYPVLGLGEALEFFEASPYASATYASDIAKMVSRLNALQNSDGSWNQGDPSYPPYGEDVQSTAYAVMGLNAAHAWTAARNGANWLMSQQQPNGGWLETDSNEYSEIDSEAMSALMSSIAQLTVISAHGSPTPPVGTSTYFVGTTITASVTPPVVFGPTGTEYVCTGWTGTGDVPASGTGTTVTFTLTKDPTLTWNWLPWVPQLSIEPATQEIEGPCAVGDTFPIDVYLWNVQSLTGVDVYAYDFNVTWTPNPFFTLYSVNDHIPFSAGNYFVIANNTLPGNYHLAVTATGAGNGLTNINNVSLVTLTFVITAEPNWPIVPSYAFDITLNGMSADGTIPVPITDCEVDNGTFALTEPQPDMCISSPSELGPFTGGPYVGDYYVTERALGTTFTLDVYLQNVTNAYGFYVQLDYNPSYKVTDVQQIAIGPAFPAPYDFLNMYVGTGWLDVLLVRPWEKPTVCGVAVLAFSVVFTETSPESVSVPPEIPTPANTTITVSSAFVLEQAPWYTSPTAMEYDYLFGPYAPYGFYSSPLYGSGEGGVAPPTLTMLDYPEPLSTPNTLVNFWNPKLADLNEDGVVNIQDLAALAQVYGVACPWGGLITPAEGRGPGTAPNYQVNIFDFVYVAKNFGDP
jgi:hypothetical protein